MKVSSILPFLTSTYVVQVSSFMPNNGGKNTKNNLKMAKTDSSKEIQEALNIGKEFGRNSKEARVAWGIVEEIDTSDNIR
mmetsp:Transcript_18711/g.22938  ORF Transcript_18711/g.22938 Transcript_18711/m.22938 type:complete len:80 (-) Transcript_18711:735-974(-)